MNRFRRFAFLRIALCGASVRESRLRREAYGESWSVPLRRRNLVVSRRSQFILPLPLRKLSQMHSGAIYDIRRSRQDSLRMDRQAA